MARTSQTASATKGWITAAIIGVLVFLMLGFGGEYGLFAALVLAVITAVLLGLLLFWLSASEVPKYSAPSRGDGHGGASASASGKVSQTAAAARTSAAASPAAAVVAPTPQAAPAPPAEAESPARDGVAAKSAEDKPAGAAPEPGAAPAKAEPAGPPSGAAPASARKSTEKPAGDQAAPAPGAEPAEPAKPATTAMAPTLLTGEEELAGRKGTWSYQAPRRGASGPGKPAPTQAAGTAPAKLAAARGGTPDDLKLIKGVGPKLEAMLNGMGYYHFDQIATWNADEVAWVDDNLEGFKGRVSRDNWVDQARTLAAGGQTEFSQRARSDSAG